MKLIILLVLALVAGLIIYYYFVNRIQYPSLQDYNDRSTPIEGNASARTVINGDTLITCNFSKVKDTVDLMLSTLVDTLDVVQLENNPNAYFKGAVTTITNSYIGVMSFSKVPFLLFDRKGKFVRAIGSIGKGPNEYLDMYSTEMVEKSNRIYVKPWETNTVLVYNFRGELFPTVRLPYSHAKSVIRVNDSIVTVVVLPFNKNSAVAYQQTLDGKVIHEIKSGPYAVRPDFSNEVNSSQNTESIDLQIFQFFNHHSDTFYHYIPGKDLLIPKFTMKFKKDMAPIHQYIELPDYYLTLIMMPVPLRRNSSGVKKVGYIGVNKKTLETHYIRLINDYMGNVRTEFDLIRKGMYVENIHPVILKEKLEQIKSNGKYKNLNSRLNKMLENADDDSNNVVIFGKMKR